MLGSEAIHPNKTTVEEGVTYFYLNQITGVRQEQDKVYLQSSQSELMVHFITDTLFRVKLNVAGKVSETTTDAIAKKDFPLVNAEVVNSDASVSIKSKALEVKVSKNPFGISVYNLDGELICAEEAGKSIGWNEKKEVFCHKVLKDDERFYGFGEKSGYLNKRGTKQIMWNTDVYAPHNEETIALYQSIPFFISCSSSTVYGIFLDNPAQTEFDMTNQETYSFKAAAGDLDYYFFFGANTKDLITQYTELTGRMPLPPKWALGFQQSRYSYMNDEDVRSVAATMREKQIPCDVIYLDIHYMDEYRVFTWHPTRFPQGEKLIADLEEQGFHVVPIVDPGVKKDPRYKVYQEGIEKDYFCKYLEGQVYTGDVWPGESAFPDFTEDKVQEWWGELHEHYTSAGIKGIWNDMNEPAIFNETKTMDLDVIHSNNGDPKTHKDLHNLYGYFMSKATYEGLKKQLKGERPFVVTRAGYAGIQRYAAIWTGDNRSFWDHLAMSIPMFLNMGLSGLPFIGSDVGGFAHPSNGPLLARWTQLGAFTPFFRNHSAIEVPRQEPWRFGEEVESICRKYIELRYRLMPHLYNLFYEASQTGIPVLRPLMLEYPHDPMTYDNADQLLVGDSILLAPVYRPDTNVRLVYLPEGRWVDFWTEKTYEGGQHITVPTPLDTMPIFVKAGSFIAEGPVEQYAGEKKGADLGFHYYPSTDESALTFYEDDGKTFDYEQGIYNQIALKGVKDETGSISISYQYEKKSYDSGRANIRLYVHQAQAPTEVTSESAIEWNYDSEKQVVEIIVADDKTINIILNFTN